MDSAPLRPRDGRFGMVTQVDPQHALLHFPGQRSLIHFGPLKLTFCEHTSIFVNRWRLLQVTNPLNPRDFALIRKSILLSQESAVRSAVELAVVVSVHAFLHFPGQRFLISFNPFSSTFVQQILISLNWERLSQCIVPLYPRGLALTRKCQLRQLGPAVGVSVRLSLTLDSLMVLSIHSCLHFPGQRFLMRFNPFSSTLSEQILISLNRKRLSQCIVPMYPRGLELTRKSRLRQLGPAVGVSVRLSLTVDSWIVVSIHSFLHFPGQRFLIFFWPFTQFDHL